MSRAVAFKKFLKLSMGDLVSNLFSSESSKTAERLMVSDDVALAGALFASDFDHM